MATVETDEHAEKDSIFLYYHKAEGYKIEVKALFRDGNLIIDGYDCGDLVEKVQGDWDHEYWLTLPPASVNKLYKVLSVRRNDRDNLLKALTKHAYGEECYSMCREFLTKNDIEFDAMFWS
ncbi:MAG: hypothetical protein QGG02_12180 [Gammaproteobacteria bacterium]|jgi:hypothetical protein|nr:hypothetical protein [Gammaproteobacteria bacterium]MDP6734343.1 hypothetical protein [Gammaproteobacteria bacterium]